MIICAAIRVQFDRDGKSIDAVIPGYRHSSCWELMAALGLPPKSRRSEIEGFIDHTGAFLDRREAYNHALMCGQLSDTTRTTKTDNHENELYSEDLY